MYRKQVSETNFNKFLKLEKHNTITELTPLVMAKQKKENHVQQLWLERLTRTDLV